MQYIGKYMGFTPKGEWSVAYCCGDTVCRAIIVAIKVGEEWNQGIPMVPGIPGPCKGCVVWVEAVGNKIWGG